MRNILILVFLSMWMAIPAQAYSKIIRPATFIWTEGEAPGPVVSYSVYLSIDEGIPQFYASVPREERTITVLLPYTEKVTVIVVGVSAEGTVGPFSDPSKEYAMYPNYDLNRNGCVNAGDIARLASYFGRSITDLDANLDGVVGISDITTGAGLFRKCIINGEYK